MKKLVTLKVEETDIARWDAKAGAWGISRAALIGLGIDRLPEQPEASLSNGVDSADIVPRKQPRRQRVPRTESINVAAIKGVAGWGDNKRPAGLKQPKKGK